MLLCSRTGPEWKLQCSFAPVGWAGAEPVWELQEELKVQYMEKLTTKLAEVFIGVDSFTYQHLWRSSPHRQNL